MAGTDGRGDADGCASSLEELIKLREEHGPEDKVSSLIMIGRLTIAVQHSQPPLTVIAPRLAITISNPSNRELHTFPSPRIPFEISSRNSKTPTTSPTSSPSGKFSRTITPPSDPPRGDCAYHRRS